jgi:TM2 domain-containing membrane protein YozV
MYCKYCGKDIDEKAEICVHCGRRVRSSISSFLENNEITQLRRTKDQKSPGLAAFLGFLLSWVLLGPLGYLYLGQWNWFWITLLISFIAYPLTFGLAYVLFPFIFAFHQYQMAKELNDALKGENKVPDKTESTPAEG